MYDPNEAFRQSIKRHHEEWETRRMIENILDEKYSQMSEEAQRKAEQMMTEQYLKIIGQVLDEINRGKSPRQAIDKIKEELGFEIDFKE